MPMTRHMPQIPKYLKKIFILKRPKLQRSPKRHVACMGPIHSQKPTFFIRLLSGGGFLSPGVKHGFCLFCSSYNSFLWEEGGRASLMSISLPPPSAPVFSGELRRRHSSTGKKRQALQSPTRYYGI